MADVIIKIPPSGGGGGAAVWGDISGTLTNQTDLAGELGNKLESPIAISDVTDLSTNLSNKQDTLVSGTNIKTINSTSLLGSGNIDTGGLTNWTESNYLYNTKYGVKFTPNSAQTNVDAVIQPKGTGGILAQQPDGTTTGGNNRGANAVDLQTVLRTANTCVASGSQSVVSGGGNNTASATSATVSGGVGNTASQSQSVVAGGGNNTASGNRSAGVS